jgi:hypothetical protein
MQNKAPCRALSSAEQCPMQSKILGRARSNAEQGPILRAIAGKTFKSTISANLKIYVKWQKDFNQGTKAGSIYE